MSAVPAVNPRLRVVPWSPEAMPSFSRGTRDSNALALGTEAPEPGVMDRPPRSRNDRIVDIRLIVRSLLWLGTLQTALCLVGFYFLWWTMGYRDLLHLSPGARVRLG